MPDDVLARGRMVLADSIGCMIAGGNVPEVRRLLTFEQRKGAGRDATVLGAATGLHRAAAAFINGTAGTWHDLDEGNLSTKTHAAIQLVPAAFAEAEAARLSGQALLEATIVAYEASARLWRATKARHAVHPHGTYGPLASAIAIGKLRGFGPDKLANAAGIALTMGLASSRRTLDDGATVRNIYTGISGRHGFEALDLDEAGLSAEADAASSILGSIYGLDFDAGMVTAGLGDTWWIRRNYFKRYASGRYTHGALDLAEVAKVKYPEEFKADTIERIDIRTYFLAATLARQTARTPFGVRFSIPMLVASHIIRGVPPLTDDCSGTLADPDVCALAKRIFVSEDAAATAAYPDQQPTHMTVAFRDGSSREFSSNMIIGESDNPLSEDALREKFVALAGFAWRNAPATAWADLMRIDEVGDVHQMVENWQIAARTP